jgi:uncharacterized membrane protein YidH (DUF202 family)
MPGGQGQPTHTDAGLQPERTDLAWHRTMLALVVAAAMFLRWTPHHGWFTGTLVILSIIIALIIGTTSRRRLHRSVHGINQEHMPTALASTATLAAGVVTLAILGIYTVLFLPIEH